MRYQQIRMFIRQMFIIDTQGTMIDMRHWCQETFRRNLQSDLSICGHTPNLFGPYWRRISGSSESPTRLACNPHEHTTAAQIIRAFAPSRIVTSSKGRGLVSVLQNKEDMAIGIEVLPRDIARALPVPQGIGEMVIRLEELR